MTTHTLGLLGACQDAMVMSRRCLTHLTRRLDTMITTVVLPVAILLLFTYLFGGAIAGSLPVNIAFIDYVLPGVLMMSIGYCATTTATSVNDDISKGIVERFKTMPIARSAFIVGHVVAGVTRGIIACLVVTGIAILMGFHSPARLSAWLLAIAILLLFMLALSTLAVLLGLLAGSPDAASAYGMPLMFIVYFSGAFAPLETMPAALKAFCTYQPVNVVWQAVSGLLLGQTGHSVSSSVLWCLGVTIFALATSGVLFARRLVK
jgi:ABC-2 type transport system permease protein